MRIFRRHIIQSLTLFLLLTAGVALIQMHDTLHLVEDVIFSSDHHDGIPDKDTAHQECLNCIIVYASADLTSSYTSPDCTSVTIESKPTLTHFSSAPTAWFLLRAPPVG